MAMAKRGRNLDGEKQDLTTLRDAARGAMDCAHAPYSQFRVGAALEAVDGAVFAGCNIENASFAVTLCAERAALGAAVASGRKDFRRVWICSTAEEPTPPCGVCRQALSEFGDELEVISEGATGRQRSWRLSDLLPARFDLERARRSPVGDATETDRRPGEEG